MQEVSSQPIRTIRPAPAHRGHPERYHLEWIADLYAAVIDLRA
jgi:hypothetical protein